MFISVGFTMAATLATTAATLLGMMIMAIVMIVIMRAQNMELGAVIMIVIMIASWTMDVGLGCVIMAIVVIMIMVASRAVNMGFLSGVGFQQVEELILYLHHIFGQDTYEIFDPLENPGKEPNHKVGLFAFWWRRLGGLVTKPDFCVPLHVETGLHIEAGSLRRGEG